MTIKHKQKSADTVENYDSLPQNKIIPALLLKDQQLSTDIPVSYIGSHGVIYIIEAVREFDKQP